MVKDTCEVLKQLGEFKKAGTKAVIPEAEAVELIPEQLVLYGPKLQASVGAWVNANPHRAWGHPVAGGSGRPRDRLESQVASTRVQLCKFYGLPVPVRSGKAASAAAPKAAGPGGSASAASSSRTRS